MASVIKRRWQKPNGAMGEGWQVRYIDPATGKRPSKTFTLKKDADAFLRKVEREIEQGTYVTDNYTLSVAEVCSRYIIASEARMRRGEIGTTSLEKINIMVSKHIVLCLGKKLFKDLKTTDVDFLYDTLTSTISAFYARMIVGNMATIERWAIRQGYLHTSPVTNALRGIRRPIVPRIEEFTAEQISTILRHVLTRSVPRQRYGAMVSCFVHLAACCGLRKIEISALDRGSVDLDRKRLRIRRNLTCLGELKGPKSKAGNRDIPLPDHLCAMLKNWFDLHFVDNEGDYVFTTYTAKPICPTNVRHGWHTVLKECGMFYKGAVYHFHALRHFSGSWWLENGMSIQDVALQLGHASPATTLQIYAHTVSKVADRQESMTHMGKLLLPTSDAGMTHSLASY